VIDEQLPESQFGHFTTELKEGGVSIEVIKRGSGGVFNALEWLIPTGVILILAKPYFETIMKKMAEDHYAVSKKAISKLWLKFFGEKPEITQVLCDSSGVKESPFSRGISLGAMRVDGGKVILRFSRSTPKADFDLAVEEFERMVSQHYAEGNDGVLWKAMYSLPHFGPQFEALVYLNPETKKLELVDYIQSSRQKRLVTVQLDERTGMLTLTPAKN
jgi:hypothetical protein